MAILKHIASKNADYGESQRYLMFQYNEDTMKPLLDENGRLIPREEYYLDGINCDPFTFDMECKELNAQCQKNQRFDEIKSHIHAYMRHIATAVVAIERQPQVVLAVTLHGIEHIVREAEIVVHGMERIVQSAPLLVITGPPHIYAELIDRLRGIGGRPPVLHSTEVIEIVVMIERVGRQRALVKAMREVKPKHIVVPMLVDGKQGIS